jgi:hypothetical protein
VSLKKTTINEYSISLVYRVYSGNGTIFRRKLTLVNFESKMASRVPLESSTYLEFKNIFGFTTASLV